MQALIINVKDAGIFGNPRRSRTKDKVLSYSGVSDRKNSPYFSTETGKFTVSHVANLLRVLFGERPVPTFRDTHDSFTGDPYFEELAKKTYIKVETPIFTRKVKDGEEGHYPDEKFTVRKSVSNSWNTSTSVYFIDGEYVQVKGGLLYPDRLKRYLGQELFNKFVALVNEYGGAFSIQAGIELLNVHKKDKKVIDFCSECVEAKRSSIPNIITGSNPNSVSIQTFSSKYPLNTLMTLGAVQNIEKVSATMYIPVSEEDLKRIDNATGVATFLEGGLVTIQGVEPWSEILTIGNHTPVAGEICT